MAYVNYNECFVELTDLFRIYSHHILARNEFLSSIHMETLNYRFINYLCIVCDIVGVKIIMCDVFCDASNSSWRYSDFRDSIYVYMYVNKYIFSMKFEFQRDDWSYLSFFLFKARYRESLMSRYSIG